MGFDKTKIEFSALLRAQTGLIFFRSPEEERGRAILREVAKLTELPLFFWTPAQGLKNELGDAPVYSTLKIFSALDHIAASDKPAIYALCDMDTLIPDIVVQSRLKEMSRKFKDMPGGIVIMCGHDIVPDSLRSYSSTVEAEPPSEKEYGTLISTVMLRLSSRMPVVDALDDKGYRRMIAALKGLSLFQAEQVITRAVIEDGKLSAEDIAQAMAAKKRIIQEQGLLEYYSSAESLADVAGLDGLKGWLAKRKKIFTDPAKAKSFGLPFPKGVLIIGVQGCGKSLCAKAVANEWGLPLLRLDPALLFDKYIGASERNLTAALAAAEKMAPAVLWIDEIEKAFSSVPGDDGGTSMRVLGGFLTWLSDRKGDVFAVATANDISALPPELTRKGHPTACVRRIARHGAAVRYAAGKGGGFALLGQRPVRTGVE